MDTIVILVCARMILILTLVPAVAAKIGHIQRVGNAITKWRIVPHRLARPLSWAIILAELAVLLAVSSGLVLRVAAILAFVLFGAIAGAAATVVARGLSTSCSCFSLEGTEKVSNVTVIRAGVLSLLALVVVWGSTWSIRPVPVWSSALVLLTLPLWVALLRRGAVNRAIRAPETARS